MSKNIKIIFGAAPFGGWTAEQNQGYLDILTRHNVVDIDTAYIYPGSEKALGEIDAPSKFIVHTKTPGFQPGSLAKDSVLQAAEKSFAELKTDSVDVYFLHSPDPETPIEETLDAVQDVYKSGKFKRFGLSNFKLADVRKIHAYAASKNYVLPTVFQGNYNPVSRHYETTLFPGLRELGIAFYAYSPLAGGFLTKSPAVITEGKGQGRWDPTSAIGGTYVELYNKPTLVKALTEWEAVAKEAGVSKAALAYRWVAHNSILSAELGDGIIVGATAPQQLEETLKALEEGKLGKDIVGRIDRVWELVKDEAPLDNYHRSAF